MPSRSLPNLWSPRGRIHRETYVVAGVVLATIKFAIDAWVAWGLFGRPWSPVRYFAPSEYAGLLTLGSGDRLFFGTLLLFSLPFAWIGVALTVRRLRAAGLPLWWSAGFFMPLLNIVLFIALCVLPSQPGAEDEDADAPPRRPPPRAYLAAAVPTGPWGAGVLAVFVTSLLGLGATVLGTQVVTFYGWGVFTALPFCLGLFSVLIFSYHEPRGFGACMGVATCAIGLVAGLMFLFAFEGLLCLMMAVPLWVPCTWIGAAVGYFLQRGGRWCVQPHLLLAIAAALPLVVTAEHLADPAPPLRSVSTAVDIGAPPRLVWDRVIAFPALPEPTHWLFKAGVAYPTHATIAGRGDDAVRYCTFSTGSFVEPIEVWDEPRLLRFAVTENPPTMREWTVYAQVDPPHLQGFMTSERGQFLLTTSAGSSTRLEGTTWYRNRMWPQAYWGLWSDYIIHRIHGQVLGHIRGLAESRAQPIAAGH